MSQKYTHTITCLDRIPGFVRTRVSKRLKVDPTLINRYAEGRSGPEMTARVENALRELELEEFIVRRVIVPERRLGEFLPPEFQTRIE